MNTKCLVVAALLIAMPSFAPVWGTIETTPVALSGDPAPGAPGRTFDAFHAVTINDAGAVMFGAQLDPSDLTDNAGIWYGEPGDLTLVARTGEPAPGVPGRSFSSFFINGTNNLLHHEWHPQHNRGGQVVVVAYLDGPDPAEEAGIWKGEPGNLQLIALAGDPAPGAPGRTFKWFANPLIDDAGNVLFYGVLENFDRGIWLHRDDGLIPIAVQGAEVPGLPGTSYTTVPWEDFDMAPTGEIVYRAILPDPDYWGLFAGTPDAIDLVLLGYTDTPDVPGSDLVNVVIPGVVAGGRLIFGGNFGEPGASGSGAFYGLPDDLHLAVRDGDPVPSNEGDVYQFVGRPPLMNAAGAITFFGGLETPTPLGHNHVLVTGVPGAWRLVAQTARTAPGSGGQVFGQPSGGTFQAVTSNDTGIVAFQARLPSSSRNGLWVWHEGDLEAAAAGPVPLEIGPGDERPVSRVRFVGRHGIYGRGGVDGLNDLDEVAYDVAFEDGSRGIFVSRLVTATNEPPRCEDAHASITELWPPDHEFLPATILGVIDPDGDEITLRVDAVTSDETPSGPGNPHAPDAFVEAGATVQLRAERFGGGNGRVYEIRFTASDGIDSCEGAVRVTVPHDLDGTPPIDDGQDHDATRSSE